MHTKQDDNQGDENHFFKANSSLLPIGNQVAILVLSRKGCSAL